MKLKPTHTENKERDKAKLDEKLYYKRVLRYEPACPFCEVTTIFNATKQVMTCECSEWKYDWSVDKYVRTLLAKKR